VVHISKLFTGITQFLAPILAGTPSGTLKNESYFMVAGLFLILGIYPRSAALIINGMLFVFIITLAINFVRGHEFNCGCFSVRETGYINAPEQWIFRDIIYFVLGIYVLLYSKRRRGCIVR